MAEFCAPLPAGRGGYECEFVDSIPDSLSCPVCFLPFRDPHLVSCCGAKYCEQCIDRVKAAGQPCPLCKEQFSTMLDRSVQRRVLELMIHCVKKEDGCQWVGELRHHHKHEEEECEFAILQCRYGCGQLIPRLQLREHEDDVCPQRPVDVKLERVIAKMEVMLTTQKDRHEKEMHAMEERHKKAMARKDESHHAEINELKQLLDRKLMEQEKKIKDYASKIKEMEKSLSRNKEIISHLMKGVFIYNYNSLEFIMTEYKKHKEIGNSWHSPPFYTSPGGYKMCISVTFVPVGHPYQPYAGWSPYGAPVGSLFGAQPPVGSLFGAQPPVHKTYGAQPRPPVHRTYGAHRPFGSYYESPFGSLYGAQPPVSSPYDAPVGVAQVYIHLMRGDHDDKLVWPFHGDITIQIVNQHRDNDHYERTILFNDVVAANGYSDRVTSGEMSPLGYGYELAMPCSVFESTTGATQYLKNNSLKFRVTKIVDKSVH